MVKREKERVGIPNWGKWGVFIGVAALLFALLWRADWGGDWIENSLPPNLIQQKGAGVSGNPIRGFFAEGAWAWNEPGKTVLITLDNGVRLSNPWVRIAPKITVEGCRIEATVAGESFPIGVAIPKVELDCILAIELGEQGRLEGSLKGYWSERGESHLTFVGEQDQVEGDLAFLDGTPHSSTLGVKKGASFWKSIKIVEPGWTEVQWSLTEGLSVTGTGWGGEIDFVLTGLTSPQTSARVHLPGDGWLVASGSLSRGEGSWGSLDYPVILEGAAGQVWGDILFGSGGRFEWGKGGVVLFPDRGEIEHHIFLESGVMSGSIRLVGKEEKESFPIRWRYGGGDLSVAVTDFPWLLPKPAPWWPRARLTGWIELSSGVGEGEIALQGPSAMWWKGREMSLASFESRIEVMEGGQVHLWELDLRLKEPLAAAVGQVQVSPEGELSGQLGVAATMGAVTEILGGQVGSLLLLFAGVDMSTPIRVDVGLGGTIESPTIGLQGSPERKEWTEGVGVLEDLHQMAKGGA